MEEQVRIGEVKRMGIEIDLRKYPSETLVPYVRRRFVFLRFN